MTTQYQLRLYNSSGQIQHVVTDMLSLAYTREVNAPGLLQFELAPEHAAVASLGLDSQVEVWRTNPAAGIGWSTDFAGLWRGAQVVADSDGRRRYRAFCPGQMELLARSIVAYAAETANRSTFTNKPAETIAKTLVKYNATSFGHVSDGRKRNVTLAGIVLEGDAGRGNVLDIGCAWRKLLDVLQEIAKNGDGDFDLVKSSATQWEFKWYPGQLGADRSGSVTFALHNGNVANPVLRRDYTAERTVAIVGGQGQESERSIVVRQGANYDAAHNATEMFVDARQLETVAALQAAGDAALWDVQTRDEMAFEVLQMPQTLYGRDYVLGDLVTGVVENVAAVKQVRRVTVSLGADGAEKIAVELSNV